MAVLLLTSMSASAGDVYDCADTASNGFQWKDGRYHPALFDAQEFKMELDGMRVQLTDITGWADGTYECERIWGFIDRHYLTCRRTQQYSTTTKRPATTPEPTASAGCATTLPQRGTAWKSATARARSSTKLGKPV